MGEPAFVVVGAGLAGAKAVEALRGNGYDGKLVLIGDEQVPPYERPGLSKGYLQGRDDRASLDVLPEGWYAEHDVYLKLGRTVEGIDRSDREVHLAEDRKLKYRSLLLATGASPRRIPLPGSDLRGVHYLRRVEDSDALRTAFATAQRVVVVGAGWIGLETAAAARIAGAEVTVLEVAQLPLLAVLGAEAAQVFADLHREHGVDLRPGVQVAEITGTGAVDGVRLLDGTRIPADVVVVGVGIRPNDQLASDAGLWVENGVRVDAHLRTSDADVYAAGDVANAMHPLLRQHIRVEHWANALNQPAVAAASMMGRDATYDRLPYFYTDQYDLGMEYVGYVAPGGYDRVVFRGDRDGREFVAFWLSRGRVLAGMNVNVWDVVDHVRALVTSGVVVDPDRLADTSVPLQDGAEAFAAP